jgi:hypothetical protein
LANAANKTPEPPLSHPGAPTDAERAKQPPLVEQPPHESYPKKPQGPMPLYEPYKGM